MRDFTMEEAIAYKKSLDKIYKPFGININDLSNVSQKTHADIGVHCDVNNDEGSIRCNKKATFKS